ncbi:hypothetical protein [Comamonas aquatica]|uniref:Uncharacterized protein n=1 Tax=Comamonas aquatica TaxID=225991 RepID=A0AA42HV15_9BURK|nr:hypothetical protein [Comamonas aquatica]MDH0363486.1 hypothetical protein [Comamonas aquatica]
MQAFAWMGAGMSRASLFTHLLLALVAGLLVWVFQDARMAAAVAEVQLQASDYRLQVTEEKRSSDRRTYQTAQAIHLSYQEALNDSLKEQARLAGAAAAAQRNAGRLRDQLRDADVRIATASAAAVRDYAATANQLLGQCSDRYTELAAKADGHALDARTCRAAWPVMALDP